MRSAHQESFSLDAAVSPTDNHPPTMVPLNSNAAPGTSVAERVAPAANSTAAKPSQDDSPVPSSPELASDGGDEEAFDVSGSESDDEMASEGELIVNEEKSELIPKTPEPVPLAALPRAPALTSATPNPPPLTSGSHGPMPRVRPVPRVSAAPQPFIPPPLPPGLHATAELMAFTQELFNVVGRFQS